MAKLRKCDICGKSHRKLTARNCLLGRKSNPGELYRVLKTCVQLRDEHICVRCGKYCRGEREHMSHVYRAGRCGYLKYDLQNVKTLCLECHTWWHETEAEAGVWFKETFPERSAYLSEAIVKYRQMPGTIPMPWYRNRLKELRDYIKEKLDGKDEWQE